MSTTHTVQCQGCGKKSNRAYIPEGEFGLRNLKTERAAGYGTCKCGGTFKRVVVTRYRVTR